MSLYSIRKKGYLYKLPVKGIVKKWNKRWFVLHATTIDGIVRLEYFDTEECEVMSIGKRTIPLRECSKLTSTTGNKLHPYVFQFTSRLGHHVFAAESHTDMEEWMSALQAAVQEDKLRNSRHKKTQSMLIQPGSSGFSVPVSMNLSQEARPATSEAFESSSSGVYRVTLEQNESGQRLNFTGSYNLEINPIKITLVAADSGAEMAVWKYKCLRTYGKAHGKFNFECGRSAETGAGTFIFNTTCAKEIFGVVHRNIKLMRSKLEKVPKERVGMKTGLPKQQSAPALSQIEKRKKKAQSMSIGTYRMSKEFENLPSYDDIVGVEEETVQEKGKSRHAVVDKSKKRNQAPASAEKAATGTDAHFSSEDGLKEGGPLYAVVDKSKKKKRAPAQQESANIKSETEELLNPLTGSTVSNDPFVTVDNSAVDNASDQQRDSFSNPFQSDPFSTPTKPNNSAFDVDPFVIPPLPEDLEKELAESNVFDTFENIDSSTGHIDMFNFNPNTIQIVHPPSLTEPPLLLSSIQNTLANDGNQQGIGFDVDLEDERLFETLAELELQEDRDREKNTGSSHPSTLGSFSSSLPSPPPTSSVTSASGVQKNELPKKLTQKEFDDLWNDICATLPQDN